MTDVASKGYYWTRIDSEQNSSANTPGKCENYVRTQKPLSEKTGTIKTEMCYMQKPRNILHFNLQPVFCVPLINIALVHNFKQKIFC